MIYWFFLLFVFLIDLYQYILLMIGFGIILLSDHHGRYIQLGLAYLVDKTTRYQLVIDKILGT